MKIFRRRDAVTCRLAVQLLTDYLDDALPPRRRRDLEHHLAHCPHCATYLAQIQATIAASGRIEPEQLSRDAQRTLVDLYRRTR